MSAAGERSSSPSSLFLRRVGHGQRRVEEEEEEEGPACWWGYSASILDGKGEERKPSRGETGGGRRRVSGCGSGSDSEFDALR